MGLKGKLIASVEMKCGEGSFFDIFHINTNQVPNISPKNIVHFGIHEGESVKTGSIVSWKYNEAGQEMYMKHLIEAADPQQKLIKWKVIEGDLLKLYKYCNFTTSCDGQWTTWTIDYEKKTEDTPEPLLHLGVILAMTKDIESHLLKK
ncbi:kirola [Solanum lycopersicum]|uniref:Bet v I/Major latex protein domain-containing protein n=1 Tax=Solanum lycopersicum TaxID=4081 RepID=A0A3Q7FV86_SOLLC|nr:kirola [Solanum lycopersicum]